MQLAYRLAKLALCRSVAARSFVLDQQRMATGGHGPWPSSAIAADQQQQRHRRQRQPPPPYHAHCRGDKFSHCFLRLNVVYTSSTSRRSRSRHTGHTTICASISRDASTASTATALFSDHYALASSGSPPFDFGETAGEGSSFSRRVSLGHTDSRTHSHTNHTNLIALRTRTPSWSPCPLGIGDGTVGGAGSF
uniref:Putative secreted peptide n=1 Tax=Anopheles braziliensis TaxID=58242 RepID=A0A2M3ZT02_9DIPT